MAAWLHDIGKIVVPLSVMNKETSLGGNLPLVLQRLDYIKQRVETKYWRQRNEGTAAAELEDWRDKQLEQVARARRLIKEANDPGTYVTEEMIGQLEEIADLSYLTVEGEEQDWLSDEELKALSVQKGTLTKEEKELMEQHVDFAIDILEFISFPERLANVPDWIVQHHEFLDGSGYPEGLEGEEISLEGRILALMDIFDALTASDRPYKDGMDSEQALSILEEMVEDNKLDRDVFELFKENDVADYLEDAEYDFFDLQEVRVE
jgi:hypothetical protein